MPYLTMLLIVVTLVLIAGFVGRKQAQQKTRDLETIRNYLEGEMK